MKAAGNLMASDLMDATIAKDMNGLGGSKNWEEYELDDKENADLIKAYLSNEIDSVTAIYIAMSRKAEEDDPPLDSE